MVYLGTFKLSVCNFLINYVFDFVMISVIDKTALERVFFFGKFKTNNYDDALKMFDVTCMYTIYFQFKTSTHATQAHTTRSSIFMLFDLIEAAHCIVYLLHILLPPVTLIY